MDLLFTGMAERPIWGRFLTRLSASLGGAGAAFLMAPRDGDDGTHVVLSPSGEVEGFDRLFRTDALWKVPPETPCWLETDGEGVPVGVRPAGAGGAAVLRLSLGRDWSVWLVVRGGQGWSEVLSALLPTLRRVVPLFLMIGDLERRRLIAEYVLETSGIGMMLVDGDGVLVHANAAAMAIIGKNPALLVSGGRVAARQRDENRELARQIREKSAEQDSRNAYDCYTTLSLSHPDHAIPLTVIVRPGPPFGPISGPLRRTATLVLRDPAQELELFEPDLERLFGISPAEAKVARLLATGLSTEEAARQLGVSRNTIRTQLQSIYAKTGASRQGELVRVLLSSVATLAQRRP